KQLHDKDLAYWNARAYEAAIGPLTEAIQIQPGAADLYEFLADCHLAMSDYQSAIRHATKAIELEGHANAYDTRARAYMRLENYRQAIADLSNAIQKKGDYLFAFLDRRFYRTEIGDKAGSVLGDKKAIAIAP